MPGQYIFVENPISANPAKLEKRRIPPMSEFMRREGLALELPFVRRDVDHKFPDKKVETIPIALKNATFDPVQVHREKGVLETGNVSIISWLAKLAIAGFRVHNTAGEAQVAQNASSHKSTIDAVLARFIEEGYEKTGVNELVGYLIKNPRGANAVFDQQTLPATVTKMLVLGDAEKPLPQAIARHLFELADSWSKDGDKPVSTEQRAEALLLALGNPVSMSALTAIVETTPPESLSDFGISKSTLSYSDINAGVRQPESDDTTAEGVLETGLSSAAFKLGDPSDAISALTSAAPTYNGLGWLLSTSKGMGMFVNGKAADLADHFGAPLVVIQDLQKDAQAIVRTYSGAFGKLHYLRSQIGGGLSSFADRYFTRLKEIQETATQLQAFFEDIDFPQALLLPDSDRAFLGAGFTAKELHDDWERLAQEIPQLGQHVTTLRGLGVAPATTDTLNAVDEGLDRVKSIFGRIRLVLNNLRMWREDIAAAQAKGKPEAAGASSAALSAIVIPDALVSAIGFKGWVSQESDPEVEESGTTKTVDPEPIVLRKVARRRVTSAHIQEQLEQRKKELDEATQKALGLTDLLLDYQPLIERMVTTFTEQDRRHYANRGEDVTDQFLETQSRRHVLDEWFRFWSSLSRPSIDYAQTRLVDLDLGYSDDPSNKDTFGWRRKAHDFMHRGTGNLWKSLFAKGKHKPYGMNTERLLSLHLEELAQQMTEWLEDQYEAKSFETAFVDYHALVAKRMEMAARTTRQPVTPEDLGIEDWPLPTTFRPADKAVLERSLQLSGRDVARIAGRLAVSLRDAASLLNRQRHLDSATFKPVLELGELGYVSKTQLKDGSDRYWTPPERLWVSETPAGEMLRSMLDERRSVAVSDLLGQIKERLKNASPEEMWALRGLLKEMPHYWAIATDLPGIQGGVECAASDVLMVGKESVRNGSTADAVYPMLLTPAWSNLLDECLTGNRNLMPGNLTFRYSYDKADGYQVSADRVEVHVPTSKVAAETDDKDHSPYLDRLIGIDLGERGIGFSVRDVSLKGHPLIERGTVPVPAIRNLISATRHFRQRRQKSMSLRTSHVNFEQMRESVAGNVVSVIKYLMWHYKALPVLEADLNNLDSGQRQLSHVYSAVTDTFLSRAVPTVDKARTNTWRGYRIVHPYLERVVTDPKSKATSLEPFKLFPGTGVRAANTSKLCSGCGVNPIATLRKHAASRIALDENGCAEFEEATLQFFTPASINRVVKGQGSPEPIANRIMEKAQLLSHLKNSQLRVKPASTQSKDTSQSRYWCANVECCHHHPDQMLHSDMNAADNIVMRRCKTLVKAQA